ncbi:ISL3 family transposase [Streptomyces mirabilis]
MPKQRPAWPKTGGPTRGEVPHAPGRRAGHHLPRPEHCPPGPGLRSPGLPQNPRDAAGQGTSPTARWLRLLHALPVPLPESVPYLGVDGFAVRRGRTYATILVDTSTHRPIDVLADRTAHTFAAWLSEHSEVRIVCGDRAGSIVDGARAGAPQARQVADAWHLLHNLAEAVERVVGRHRAEPHDASNAATVCEPTPVNSTSAAAPSRASTGPSMPSS